MSFDTLTEQDIRKMLGDRQEEFDAHDFRLDNHDGELASQANRISVVETTVAGLDEAGIANLSGRVTAVEAGVASHEVDINNLVSVTGDHETRLTTAEGDVVSLDGRLTTVEGVNTTQDGRLTAVEAVNTTQDGRLTTAENTLISHGGTLTTHGSTLTTHGSRLTAAEASLVTQAGQISVLESGLRVVSTAAQLVAAITVGGRIGIFGMISLAATLQPAVAGTQLIALTGASGLIYPYSFGVNKVVIKPAADDIALIGLRITTGNPLTEVTTTDIGIAIDDSPTATVSRLRIQYCNIYGVATGITRAQFFTPEPPPPTAAIARGIKILDNDVHDFTYSGLFIASNTPGIHIERNYIHGRLDSVTHSPIRNGMWIGQNANHARIVGNEITTVGAHGIEYWNSQTDILTLNGNDMSVITGNQVYDLLKLAGGSFAISAFGSGPLMISENIIRTASIGIEVYNDYRNKGRLQVVNNYIEDIDGQGMSLNGVTNAHIAHNFIKDVWSEHGMQIINGARDLEIVDNTFQNAGKHCIKITQQEHAVAAIEGVNNGWVTLVNPIVLGRWVFEQQIRFFGLGGSVELNDEFFTISEYDNPNKRFRIGYDLSTVTPFTSGGTVHETYRRIVIDNNKFYITDPATPSDARALFLPDIVDSIVTNNKSFVLDSLAAGVGNFQILNTAARVHNGTTLVTSLPSGAPIDIGGSNIKMTWKAPLT